MISEHLLERIKATPTTTSETSALLVYIGIMASLHIHVKEK